MDYMKGLSHTVTANLAGGRIGVPVFVRWTASVAESHDVLNVQMAEMIAYTNRWLATDLRRLYATGSEARGHLSVALEYTTGSSALLALCLTHGRPNINLAIYGNHGAIYHCNHIVPIRDGSIALQSGNSDLQSDLAYGARILQDAIQRSLAVHQPVELS